MLVININISKGINKNNASKQIINRENNSVGISDTINGYDK
jgi:hypothetical protein